MVRYWVIIFVHFFAFESLAQTTQPSQNAPQQVSILCYHNFSAKKDPTEMMIQTAAFESQMKMVAESGINVISFEEFLEWKRGTRELPVHNIMITIDDGWKSVYTEAYPILKRYEFPFTLGLYREFVGKGELALNQEMIREMMQNGMTIASHSVSHPFPSEVKKKRVAGESVFTAFLAKELGASKAYFEQTFQVPIHSYIYPGGYYIQEMFPALRSYGYDCSFTVLPGKVSRDTADLEIPRYVVLGTTDRMFQDALTFSESENTVGELYAPLAHPVQPENREIITERLPEIVADLSGVDSLDKESVYMRVSGFGKVPAKFVEGTSQFRWKVTRPLRVPTHSIFVQWKTVGEKTYHDPLRWTFSIQHQPMYLQKIAQ